MGTGDCEVVFGSGGIDSAGGMEAGGVWCLVLETPRWVVDSVEVLALSF